jgi:hypothetical protein
MPERENVAPGRDWSYETISFVVLAILSALSHFWYILIVFASALVIRELVGLSFRYFMNSLRLVPWHSWKASELQVRAAHLRHQVFKPYKIS